MLTGSVYSIAPLGMLAVVLPPKVTVRRVPGTTAAPPALTPTVTAVSCSVPLPKTLDSLKRTAWPLSATVTNWRTVASWATP